MSATPLVFGLAVPLPYYIALAVICIILVLIGDAGAGLPFYFPLLRRFMSSFQPRLQYKRAKSKYLVA